MSDTMRVSWGLVIHGGAGTLPRGKMTPELESDYRNALEESLLAGHTLLSQGRASLDAVEAAVRVMEDSPLFNAGRGSSFNHDGVVEMDAAVMDGSSLRAGAVAGVRNVRNPVSLARAVMEHSPHLFLAGRGAEAFARSRGIPVTDSEYFHTDFRWNALQRAKEKEAAGGASQPPDTTGETVAPGEEKPGAPASEREEEGPPASGGQGPGMNATEMGTVGAVALDRAGNLAAATSTGGSANKRWGRIGDSPVIGAGTYAGPQCAVSCTGWGEYFIRNVVAYDIAARMEYRGISVTEAAHEVVMHRLHEQEPRTGGVVALSREGQVAMPFNTEGMYRGYVGEEGECWVGIYE